MRAFRLVLAVWTVVIIGVACAPRVVPSPPPAMLGSFVDDYGERYVISPTEWVQLPATTYRVVEWNPSEQYVVAHNAPSNRQDGGHWTRIDWVELPDMLPYLWGYCYTAFAAATGADARATPSADRRRPRTGCNGHPFSRMRSVEDTIAARQSPYDGTLITP